MDTVMDTLMDPLARLLAERECERLTYRYCLVVDDGYASQLADLFTPDGRFEAGGLRLEGRDQIRRVFTAREAVRELRTRHVCTNIAVDVTGPDTATGVVYVTLYRRRGSADWSAPVPTTQPAFVGTYRDAYARVDGTWLIRSRVGDVTFADPTDPGLDTSWSPSGH